MGLPFDITKWTVATPIPVPSGSRTGGLFQSPDSNIVFSPDAFPTFTDLGGGIEWETGWQAASYDVASTWSLVYNTMTAQPPGGFAQDAGRVGFLWSIRPPIGPRLFFRLRVKFGRSTTADNGTIGAGYVALDASQDGTFWWQQQILYTWPQVNKGVVGGQGKATIVFGAGYVSIPGSGPNGANADWLIISTRVRSHGANLVDTIGMWRSDDFGFSWVQVRDLVSQSPWVGADAALGQLTRAPGGRLHAIQIAPGDNILFSDDNGATWTNAFEPVNSAITSIDYCAGGTMIGVSAVQNRSYVSCDNGSVWTEGGTYPAAAGTFGYGSKRIGLQEHLIVQTLDLTLHNVLYSDNGGESYVSTGPVLGLLVNEPNGLVHNPVTSEYVVCTRLGNVAKTSQQAPGGFTPRTTCPLGSAGIAVAGALTLCGATIVPDKCEG